MRTTSPTWIPAFPQAGWGGARLLLLWRRLTAKRQPAKKLPSQSSMEDLRRKFAKD